ncbi:MAG: peptide chain release factor 2 [Candidatus Moranbacteria bacterium]|nr:peptide chain release factor 2 [Candidatus Moranbacteria bacterium]
MQELLEKLKELRQRVASVATVFDFPKKKKRIEELEKESNTENFWQNPDEAQKVMQELEGLREDIKTLGEMETSLDDLSEMANLAADDSEIKKEIEKQIGSIGKNLEKIEFETLFRGEYDRSNAILSIHSGTGGVDAQDWAEMLLRMYLRFAERKNWKAKVLSESRGQEAGIKSATLEISGKMAYGYLKTEAGLHRLVRLSPFNAKNLRQTSFASVEVLPEIDKIESVEINPADLKIDTFRASGAGGQHVNKTDSAVRITHLPTNLVASSQNERSQLQNKEQALKILTAKIHQRYLAEKEEQEKKLKGEHVEVQWGSQIRSYVLHPYKLVKDHRTKFESKNPEEVLDGNIEGFIETYLTGQNSQK